MRALFALALMLATSCALALPRDPAQVREFKKRTVCPATGTPSKKCAGYDVDHKKALMNGGADHPSNMQYLSKKEHKAKTKRDLAECKASYFCKAKKHAKPMPWAGKPPKKKRNKK